ncbi:MAG TPA: histidine kinase dimerization/phosphoacceptor domain -containing protein [Spirochaetia bacterium]|nr:histidine kinase dimerization/phosphoacceptor domain -containing protein [Spirochaetales bacterium]HRY79010.1 histidine kinase dimerization/phosphoacceptor domain -containing protein [Spirochaetia bacterium]
MAAAPEIPGPRRGSSLRTAILLPLASLVLLGFAASWTLYVLASRASMGGVVERLVLETTAVLDARLSRILEAPRHVGITVAEFARQVGDSESSLDLFQRVFRAQLGKVPELNIAAIGFRDGEYAEAQRLGDGRILVGRAGRSTGGALESWTCDEDGNPGELYATRPGYDPRTRPWYLRSAETRIPGWSPVYSYYSNQDLAVAAGFPVLAGGEVLAVVSVTTTLKGIHDFLNTMPQARRGVLAILDREGRTIAVTGKYPVSLDGDGMLPAAEESGNSLLAKASPHLPLKVKPESSSLRFRLEGVRYIAGISELRNDEWDLGWRVVAILPESEFTERMTESDVRGGFVFLLLLSLALLVAWLTVDGLTEPLSQLEAAVRDLAFARFSEDSGGTVRALARRRDEIGRLAASFDNMRSSLLISFETLRSNLEEKEVLLKEVHHRVKNNLQVISSMLSIQAGEIEDPKALEAFAACQERILAMAFVHEGVYQSGLYTEVEMEEYLGRICSSLRWSRAADAPRIDIRVDAREIRLPLSQAIPCGLIVNELTVNALKHAFPGERPGAVSVVLAREDPGYRLIVEDDGVGEVPSGTSVPGIGRTLVESLVSQLRGTVTAAARPDGSGLRVDIRFGTL